MTTKSFIAKNIAINTDISSKDSSLIIDEFLFLIKKNLKSQNVKISGFGTFHYNKTPERIGRNPKTKESYIIESRRRLTLSVSTIVKEKIN